ncbi:MAG: nucleotidyltransferase family protein [Bacteroidales bacterium]|nr:nucleotidyltransferase family protein [Bacteroidales bacterium]
MNKRTAMILAAGLGTRLKQLTHDKPKALVEVGGRTLLERNIENLIHNGFDTIVVNIHHFGDQVIRFLETHHYDADIYISDERGQLMDTGGGIVQALPFFHDTQAVLVHNVDILSDIPLQSHYEQFRQSHDQAWLFTQDRNTTRKLLFNEQNLLVGWRNLNENIFKWVDYQQDTYKELAFNGIHIFNPALFTSFEYQRYSIIDLYLLLAKANPIRALDIHPTYWFDIGKIEDFAQISSHFLTSQLSTEL